ncbi:hypothetical protein [Streptomyces dubilierae]|uniref:Uncharacterized protein n=1 Tax=Streptomyces dubilierae TaxID=3075533 RepID=A0ABU2P1G0_9ACTN|nr:hypothetical protein [Streptomyces sp. DSM 41921]MDT0385973.1 hypothetical protein [Streptomyces sp. DSM 41921]
MGLLLALAGGAGGEIGRQAWTGLTALVRRPAPALPDGSSVSTGENELSALADDPADTDRAHALSTALAVRAALDVDFRDQLQQWTSQARAVASAAGNVHNSINGSTVHGSVIQSGRDVHSSPPPSPSSPRRPASP